MMYFSIMTSEHSPEDYSGTAAVAPVLTFDLGLDFWETSPARQNY